MTIDLRAQLQSTLGDGYTLERELGGGGMSRVFVAHENALGRTVVVKVIAPELAEGVSAERFAREVKLAARLQQANIVPVLSTGSSGSLPYYTMPFVTGESLRARIAVGTRLSVPQAVSILRDVARALSYAHTQGVVHRDIKPENILLSGGTAVVTDFGIAKALSASRTQDGQANAAANTMLTQAGLSIGTPAYMAPEQAIGADVDHRADLYAWGVVAYELLAGAHPFAGKANSAQMIAAHLAETPMSLTQRNADVSASVNDLVQRCLAKDAAHRPANAEELLQVLDSFSTPSGVTGASAPSGAMASGGGRRNSIMIAGGVLVIVAIVAIAVKRDYVFSGFSLRLPTASSTTTSSTAAAVNGAGSAVNRSIAVLPLANLSGDKADDFFGIGLAEEMTRALSKTGVRVIGRSSAGALQARGMDESAIARELGVGSLLTGSVQRAAGQVRVNVSLVSAADGAVTWTEKYDRPLTNVFALQDEIARAVATQLLGALGGVRAVGPTRVETADPEAYAWYLQGQVLFGRRTAQTVRQSISLFERAVARDPNFARAQGALALATSSIPFYEQGTGRTMSPLALAAARKAIAIDSSVAEAWVATAQAQANLWENRAAEVNFRRAQALDSSIAISWGWHGLSLMHQGRFAEAHDRMARAQAAEPASLIARTWGAQLLLAERRYREADSATRAILAMDSTYALAWDARSEVLSYLGRHDEAIAALQHNVEQQSSSRPTQTEGILAFILARAGRVREARQILARLRTKNGGDLPAMGVLAATLEQLSDHEAAVAMLDRAAKQPDGWLNMYNRAERYDALRRDPRAEAIMASIEK